MLKKALAMAIGGVFLVAASRAMATGDTVRGKAIYESRCIACHSIDANRIGPQHRGVFGRKAGDVKDYDYSPAVRSSQLVWSEATLDRWLTDPERLIPGQKMGYQVSDAADRADLIAYLRKESAK